MPCTPMRLASGKLMPTSVAGSSMTAKASPNRAANSATHFCSSPSSQY